MSANQRLANSSVIRVPLGMPSAYLMYFAKRLRSPFVLKRQISRMEIGIFGVSKSGSPGPCLSHQNSGLGDRPESLRVKLINRPAPLQPDSVHFAAAASAWQNSSQSF